MWEEGRKRVRRVRREGEEGEEGLGGQRKGVQRLSGAGHSNMTVFKGESQKMTHISVMVK